jgi:signal transduction histidine kinase
MQAAREEERARIAREIHDGLGQALTALKMDIAWINRHINDPREVILEKLNRMSELIDDTVDVVRQVAAELRPGIVDEIGLIPAIEWHLQEFQERTSIQCDLHCLVEQTGLDPDSGVVVYRIIQEALTNVARHAQAGQVRLSISEEPDRFILQVADNGRGITQDEIISQGSLGIHGMQERARLLGGDVSIRGEPGTGTVLTLHLPIRQG